MTSKICLAASVFNLQIPCFWAPLANLYHAFACGPSSAKIRANFFSILHCNASIHVQAQASQCIVPAFHLPIMPFTTRRMLRRSPLLTLQLRSMVSCTLPSSVYSSIWSDLFLSRLQPIPPDPHMKFSFTHVKVITLLMSMFSEFLLPSANLVSELLICPLQMRSIGSSIGRAAKDQGAADLPEISQEQLDKLNSGLNSAVGALEDSAGYDPAEDERQQQLQADRRRGGPSTSPKKVRRAQKARPVGSAYEDSICFWHHLLFVYEHVNMSSGICQESACIFQPPLPQQASPHREKLESAPIVHPFPMNCYSHTYSRARTRLCTAIMSDKIVATQASYPQSGDPPRAPVQL